MHRNCAIVQRQRFSRARTGGYTPTIFLQRVRIYLIPKDLGNPVMQKSA